MLGRQIEWAGDSLAELYPVYAELQAVAATLPVAAEFLDGFQRSLCDALKWLLAPHVEADRLQIARHHRDVLRRPAGTAATGAGAAASPALRGRRARG